MYVNLNNEIICLLPLVLSLRYNILIEILYGVYIIFDWLSVAVFGIADNHSSHMCDDLVLIYCIENSIISYV